MRAAIAMLLVVALAPLPARGSATVVVRVGDPSPLGLPFSHFSDAALDDRGRITFIGGNTVLFRRTPAGIVHVAGAGDVVEGRRIVGVSAAALGRACLAYRALLVGGDVGVVRVCGAKASVLAALGSPAPSGSRIVGFADDLAVGADGGVAFIALVDDGTSVIVLVDADGMQHEVTRTRAPSPSSGTFTSLRLAGVAAGGHVGFHAATSAGPDGLFYWQGADVRTLTVVGDASPAGGAFTSLGLASMNDAETWTFRAGFAGGAQSGIFRVSTADAFPSPITAVAITGARTPVGGTFKDIPNSLVPAINGSGLVAFRATVTDSDAPTGITSGVFVAHPDGSIEKAVAVGESTAGVGNLVRLRTVALAGDGGVVLRASLIGGAAGLFRARAGQVERLALLGDPTDLGSAFRFSDADTSDSSEAPIFLGTREGVFVADGQALRTVALLGDPTPLRGQWAGFDSPASGGRATVFGASIDEGRSGEAVFALGRHRPVRIAATGDRVGSSLRLLDFFSSPLDNLARTSVAGGAVAFQAALGGRGGTTSGIVFAARGALRAVARQGRKAPGGGTYRVFGTPAVAPGARVAFVALGDQGTALYRARASGTATLVAAAGTETGTRLRGIFRGFDTPAAGSVGIAFRAMLEQSRQGIFLTRGRCTMAIAGTGESDPGGEKFRTFAAPAVAGPAVVFRAVLSGASAPSALYRAHPAGGCTQLPPSIDLIATTGAASPAGPPLLALGAPSGNRHGAVAVAADLTGAGASDAILYYAD